MIDRKTAPKAIVTIDDILAAETWRLAQADLAKHPRKACGVDGMTVQGLFGHLEQHSAEIRHDLLGGDYLWSPTKKISIEKPSGGRRTLRIPTVKDRFLLRVVMLSLTSVLDHRFSACSFGFRPGRDIFKAIEMAQNHVSQGGRSVAKIDLKKFFDQVPRDLVLQLLRPFTCKRTLTLITAGLRTHCPGKIGIGQGSPLSPLLGNLVLDLLDQNLEQRNVRFTRYADDATIFASSHASAVRNRARTIEFLEQKLGLPVNHAKSNEILDFRDAEILGFQINGDLNIVPSREAYKRLEKLKSAYSRFPNLELRRRIDGWYAHYNRLVTQAA